MPGHVTSCIAGIGTDIELVSRFRARLRDVRFLRKAFSESELAHCFARDDPSECLAARFCAKEALVKASPRRLSLSQIVVTGGGEGKKPSITVKDKRFRYGVHLSISHCRTHAVATVVLVRK